MAASLVEMPPSGPSALTPAHLDAIRRVHRDRVWPQPTRIELRNDGVLVLDYEVRTRPISLQTFVETRLLAVREALLPLGIQHYRVNVNGPPPDRGLVRRYGSARLIAGGRLEWLTP